MFKRYLRQYNNRRAEGNAIRSPVVYLATWQNGTLDRPAIPTIRWSPAKQPRLPIQPKARQCGVAVGVGAVRLADYLDRQAVYVADVYREAV